VHEEVEAFVRAEKEQFGPLAPEKARLLVVYLDDPEGSLKRLVDELRRYHGLALAPYWPRIREHLEADTIMRGQALALGGVGALLSGLHSKARYEGSVLEFEKTYEAVVEPAGRGITLVPCVFAWPRVEVLVQPGYRPTLAYGPRGVAKLWTSSPSTSNGTALEAALSTGRASVLKGLLSAPTTTTELAHQLRLSPAAVSAHLSRLRAAGLVEPHRNGRKVYYRLSYVGESLLEIFGETGWRLRLLKELIESGKVMPTIDKTWPPHEDRETIRYPKEGHARGKVVITVWYIEQRSNYESRQTRREDNAMDGHALIDHGGLGEAFAWRVAVRLR
jgi:DNA-binding transcriptional ArsR family regulator